LFTHVTVLSSSTHVVIFRREGNDSYQDIWERCGCRPDHTTELCLQLTAGSGAFMDNSVT